MAKRKERIRAIKMRKSGASYSEIKKKLNVSKGTLSTWLRDYPLSKKQLRKVRDKNPKRIERFRETMQRKREAKQRQAYVAAKKDIGELSKREVFLSGLFLY